jgi:hypothetical protein
MHEGHPCLSSFLHPALIPLIPVPAVALVCFDLTPDVMARKFSVIDLPKNNFVENTSKIACQYPNPPKS